MLFAAAFLLTLSPTQTDFLETLESGCCFRCKKSASLWKTVQTGAAVLKMMRRSTELAYHFLSPEFPHYKTEMLLHFLALSFIFSCMRLKPTVRLSLNILLYYNELGLYASSIYYMYLITPRAATTRRTPYRTVFHLRSPM